MMPDMNPRSEASEIIRRAEVELRALLLRSAELADYEAARELADWANQLKRLLGQNGECGGESGVRDLPSSPAPALPTDRSAHRDDTATAKNTFRKTRTKAARGEYPKFLRDGDELLKIGWSKRTWETYRHKAPRRVVNLVVDALEAKAKSGTRIVMEQVLPIHDPESAIEVPSYQPYLILAWLRKEKLVVQHGRDGYSLRSGMSLADAVEQRWKLLRKSSPTQRD
jgi:hypothetical protein